MAVAIEFVIVVAGVFLGMQVSNWNQARAEDTRAQAYLVRLRDDLQADVRSKDSASAFLAHTSAYADQALGYVESGARAEGASWQIVLAFYQAGQIYPDYTADATYREMSYAGDLRLIRDQRLNAALGAYYTTSAEATQQLFSRLPAYRETIRGLMPQATQAYIWDHCYRQFDISRQEMVDCASPISERQARAILQDILAEPQTIRQLRFWTTQMRLERNVLAAERADAAQLAEDVAHALR